jgi:hypothetical protein
VKEIKNKKIKINTALKSINFKTKNLYLKMAAHIPEVKISGTKKKKKIKKKKKKSSNLLQLSASSASSFHLMSKYLIFQ